MPIKLTVNGRNQDLDVAPDMPPKSHPAPCGLTCRSFFAPGTIVTVRRYDRRVVGSAYVLSPDERCILKTSKMF